MTFPEKGLEIAATTFELDAETVREYTAAVEDDAVSSLGADVAPPMAVAAFAVRGLISRMALPPGALHAGQEIEYLRPARIGEKLAVSGRVVSSGVRRGWALATVEMDVRDQSGSSVMHGRATLTARVEDSE